jgi:transcriptional regulator with XRE-family HTH domain
MNPPTLQRPRESADAILAKNLVVARLLAGITQHDLAAAAGVSRATIAQLETGVSDPRLSTLVDLSAALHISPLVLLAGALEISALAELPGDLAARPVTVASVELARMEALVQSGLLRDRGRAARIGATLARAAGEAGASAAITSGIFSAYMPGGGTIVGTAWGRLLE